MNRQNENLFGPYKYVIRFPDGTFYTHPQDAKTGKGPLRSAYGFTWKGAERKLANAPGPLTDWLRAEIVHRDDVR